MASNVPKRIGKSALNWTKYTDVVKAVGHPELEERSKPLKNEHDSLLKQINSRPEKMAPIDFDFYRSKIKNKKLVDELQQQMSKFVVPYPKAPKSNYELLEAEKVKRGEAIKLYEEYIGYKSKRFKEFINALDSLPDWECMGNVEVYAHYFPEVCMTIESVEKNPRMYPFSYATDIKDPR